MKSLDVFGSAANGEFDPAHSDIDFLVEFIVEDQGSLFHRADFVTSVTEGVTMEQLKQNRLLRQGVERNFEIIGEAVRR